MVAYVDIMLNGFFTGMGVVFANYVWSNHIQKKLEDAKKKEQIVEVKKE